MANDYEKGQNVKVSAAFTLDDVATDPTTVELKVKDPSGTVNSYTYAGGTVTKDSTGNYSKTINASLEGRYQYGFIGTGAVATAGFGEFFVGAWPFS